LLDNTVNYNTDHRVFRLELVLREISSARIGAEGSETRRTLLNDLVIILVPALVVNDQKWVFVGTLDFNLDSALQPYIFSIAYINLVAHLNIFQSI
jgi:hypothetical protein